MGLAGSGVAGAMLPHASAFALSDRERQFIAEAARMKREAVADGDQPFGAVLVKAGAIIGYGPSRVIVDRNPDAHAERVALWDAQKRLGTTDMAGTVMYSTSRPCALCERALAAANVDRMYFGPDGADGGKPRSS
jgi:tRNA(Arg) A34 adenosine deaminase TadA